MENHIPIPPPLSDVNHQHDIWAVLVWQDWPKNICRKTADISPASPKFNQKHPKTQGLGYVTPLNIIKKQVDYHHFNPLKLMSPAETSEKSQRFIAIDTAWGWTPNFIPKVTEAVCSRIKGFMLRGIKCILRHIETYVYIYIHNQTYMCRYWFLCIFILFVWWIYTWRYMYLYGKWDVFINNFYMCIHDVCICFRFYVFCSHYRHKNNIYTL